MSRLPRNRLLRLKNRLRPQPRRRPKSRPLLRNLPAEEPAAEEEEALGSTLIGEIEGPEIITDVDAYPTEFSEAPMLAEMVEAGELPARGRTAATARKPAGHRAGARNRQSMAAPGAAASPVRPTARTAIVSPVATALSSGMLRTSPRSCPTLPRGWEISEDGTQITLFLREGVEMVRRRTIYLRRCHVLVRAHVSE